MSNDGQDSPQPLIKLTYLCYTVTDDMATQRILLGSTAEVECKLGPTPFIIDSLTLIIGDKTVGVNNAPSAVKGTVAPGSDIITAFLHKLKPYEKSSKAIMDAIKIT